MSSDQKQLYDLKESGATQSVLDYAAALQESRKALQAEADAKKQLIEMMAPAKLVAAESKKSLTDKEKEAALSSFWMQKKIATTPVTDKEAQEAYDKMKKVAEEAKSTQKIPPFDVVKNSIKMQLSQEKVVAELMKNAKVIIK